MMKIRWNDKMKNEEALRRTREIQNHTVCKEVKITVYEIKHAGILALLMEEKFKEKTELID